MEFLPAICPTCGGKLQLPNDKESVQCMYCGNQIAVRAAIAAHSGPNLENYFKLAEKAAIAGNQREAYDYYTKILEYAPNDSSAWFGKAKAAGWSSTLADFRIAEMVTGFEHGIDVASDQEKPKLKKLANHEINEICSACYSIARNHLLEFVTVDNSWSDYLFHCQQLLTAMERAHGWDQSDRTTIENIVTICADNIRGVKYRNPYDNTSRVHYLSDAYEKELRDKMGRYAVRLQKLDPSYKWPDVKRESADACFIATAVSGDYDHPDVLTLRVFRDDILNRSSVGRAFVQLYYAISPPIAFRISRAKLLRTLCRFVFVTPAAVVLRQTLKVPLQSPESSEGKTHREV